MPRESCWNGIDWEPKKEAMKIELGALAPPLKKQLEGLGLNPKTIDHLQADMEAIARLAVRGYLQEGLKVRCHNELVRKIRRAARKANQ